MPGQVPASELSDIEKDLPDPWLLWRKLLALGLIFFCASFNLTILQNLKVCCRPLPQYCPATSCTSAPAGPVDVLRMLSGQCISGDRTCCGLLVCVELWGQKHPDRPSLWSTNTKQGEYGSPLLGMSAGSAHAEQRVCRARSQSTSLTAGLHCGDVHGS